jgi:hypothetical protein
VAMRISVSSWVTTGLDVETSLAAIARAAAESRQEIDRWRPMDG